MIHFEIPEDMDRMGRKPPFTFTIAGDVSRIQNISIYFKDEDEKAGRLQEYEERLAAISQQEKATGGQ